MTKSEMWAKHFELEKELGFFATTHWQAGDVQSIVNQCYGKDITLEQATEWLDCNQRRIADSIIEHGWEIINSLMSADEWDD